MLLRPRQVAARYFRRAADTARHIGTVAAREGAKAARVVDRVVLDPVAKGNKYLKQVNQHLGPEVFGQHAPVMKELARTIDAYDVLRTQVLGNPAATAAPKKVPAAGLE